MGFRKLIIAKIIYFILIFLFLNNCSMIEENNNWIESEKDEYLEIHKYNTWIAIQEEKWQKEAKNKSVHLSLKEHESINFAKKCYLYNLYFKYGRFKILRYRDYFDSLDQSEKSNILNTIYKSVQKNIDDHRYYQLLNTDGYEKFKISQKKAELAHKAYYNQMADNYFAMSRDIQSDYANSYVGSFEKGFYGGMASSMRANAYNH